MAVKVTPEEFSLLIRRLSKQWRVLAPSAEFRGGRFADTDNIIYQQIRGWDDLVWQEKSHMSPNTVISPITETLFYFNKDTIQIAETDTTPVLIFARACDINAMSRLDYMYLSNGNNSDYSYQRLRDHIRFVLIECPQSFENCFCVSMGSNKTDNYSAAMRFSDDGASVFIKDAFLKKPYREWDSARNMSLSSSAKIRSRLPSLKKSVSPPKEFATLLSIIRSGMGTTAAVLDADAAQPGVRPVPATAFLMWLMTKILSAVNAVASGPAVWYRVSAIWPADTVFASLRENVYVTVHFIKSMITKPAMVLSICAWAADAAMTAALSTLNSHVLSIK